MSTKKPTFNIQNNQSSAFFHERSVGEKSAKNRPHFAEKSASTSKHRSDFTAKKPTGFKENQRKGAFKRESTPAEIYTSEHLMKSTGGHDIKVLIKSRSSEAKGEKKTGPLSPRAPEKIKKNRAEEMKVYGENACLALFAERPENIVRVWTTVEVSHRVGHLFSYLAANKKVYHVVSQQELTLVSDTEHHGGICMLVKKSRPFTLEGYLDIPHQKDCLVLFNDLKNAHNVGGVVRTCAVYGVKGIVVDDPEVLNSAAAMRVAEGGMEYIRPLQTPQIEHALQQLRQAGYQIVHLTNSKQGKEWQKVRLENKVVFVLGETSTEHLVQGEDVTVNLSYSNPLKNGLNVAVATGVLLAKWSIDA